MAEPGRKPLLRAGRAAMLALCLAAAAAPSTVGARQDASASPASRAFATLKRLAGEWEARAPQIYGDAVIRLQYRLLSDGSVLVETFSIPEHDVEMLTVYHLDGETLALTHYCVVGNQVRMTADREALATAAPLRALTFSFRDGSNVEGAHQVMDRLRVVFDDDGHVTQQWFWRDDAIPSGRDSAVYRYTRVR